MSYKVAKIGDVCTIEKGAIGIQKAIPGEFPLVVTGEDRKSHNEFQFDCEAVIIPLVSGTGHGHASIKRIHFQSGKFALGNILCAVIPKDSKQLRAEYLFRFLDLNKENELVARMKGMANVTLPIKEIAQIEIPLPTIEEQAEFVKMYKELETKSSILSTELTHQLTLVKKLRQQLLQDAVQGKLVEQNPNDEPASELLKKIKAEKEKLIAEKKIKKEKELAPIKPEEIPFEIPENWVWCRLNDIISILGDGLHGTPNYDSNGDYYFINGNNLINGKIEIKENTKRVSEIEYLKHRKILISNTVFVSINGTLGNLAYYNGEKIILGKSACYFNLHTEILREYIGIYIKSSYFLKYAVDVASETTIKNVSLKSMRLLPIPFPPLAEQNRIVKKLDELMQFCNELEASINQSESQNEKLLQQVLREALRKESVEV
jgi:type I restriction enzyme S subunit